MVIDAGYFMKRIGEPSECPCDRRFWSALSLWQWRADWKAAKERDDWSELDHLDRKYEMIVGI